MSKTIEEIKHRQHEPYGCGLFSVANALNLDSYVTKKRLSISQKGNNIGQLTKWLIEDGYDIGINVFYYNHFVDKLPKDFLNFSTNREGALLPVLIEVMYKEKGKNHLIAGLIDSENNITIMDSLKDAAIKIPLPELNNQYCKVFGLYAFCYMENNRGWHFIYT